jgi:hypothetical protein
VSAGVVGLASALGAWHAPIAMAVASAANPGSSTEMRM